MARSSGSYEVTGPWKGVSGEGRARRELSVMLAQKIDVHVHHFGVTWKNRRLAVKWPPLSGNCLKTARNRRAKKGQKQRF